MPRHKTFLEVFSLENLSSLPTLKDIEDLDYAQLPTPVRDPAMFEDAEKMDLPDNAAVGGGAGRSGSLTSRLGDYQAGPPAKSATIRTPQSRYWKRMSQHPAWTGSRMKNTAAENSGAGGNCVTQKGRGADTGGGKSGSTMWLVSQLGAKADPQHDSIEVAGQVIPAAQKKVYIMLHKPKGHVTTLRDPEGRPTVMDLVDTVTERLYPVGRLDYDTEGLLILTNDGDCLPVARSIRATTSPGPIWSAGGGGLRKTY
ncbi:MAG: pseudouridine synthase [Marinilabiliales bacterium]|nr:pseudouridine synthase [Marinilabiliales bacterium]